MAFLFGGTLGACFALLYAPESGTHTRERIRRHTEGLREWAGDVRERVGEALEQGQEAVPHTFEDGKEASEKQDSVRDLTS